MRARIRVGGWALDAFGRVDALEDTTQWRIGDYSGTTEIKCSWAAPVRFAAPWLATGARVEVVESGIVTREGLLTEATPGEPWTIVATGLGAALEDIAVVDNGQVTTRAEVAGKSTSIYFTNGTITFPAPTGWSRTWIVRPSMVSLGVDRSNYTSRVTPYYVPTGSTTPVLGAPVVDAVLEARYGVSGKILDASNAAPMTDSQAAVLAGARLDAGGRRLGWVGEIVLTDRMFLSASGAPAMACSPRAGDTFLVPGFTDARSRDNYATTLEITAGEVIRSHDERRTVVRPVGSSATDLESIWASVPAPDSEASVIVL